MDTRRSHNVFFAGLFTALLVPLAYGQETDSKDRFLLEPYADHRDHQTSRESSMFVENQMNPDTTRRRHHSTHLGVLHGEALPFHISGGQSHSESDSVGQFQETGKTSRVDFAGMLASHFHPSEFGDEESVREADSVFSENEKSSNYRSRQGFKERFPPSSQFRRRISPDLTFLPFSREDLVDVERDGARFSENTQDTQRDVSHEVFNKEGHQPLQSGETFSDARERRPWDSFYDQSRHHDFSRRSRHQEEDQSSVPNSEGLFLEDFPYESGSSFDTEDDIPNSYLKRKSSLNSEHYPQQTLMSHNFGEKHETGEFPFESDDSSLSSEREVFRHHNPSLRGKHFNEKLKEPYDEPDSSDGGQHFINSGLPHSLRTGHFPEDPSTNRNSDSHQETKHDYPPLDICSEETHVFHSEAVSPSSPVYETQVFLPLNFSTIFHNELLDKIREYETQDFPSGGGICNTRRKRFYDTDSLNVRSMCPFRWEVTDYHPARYPPHLISARCFCQGSKFLYGQQSACTEQKGRVPVLWRVGCNNGRHVYREGWQEINVTCAPLGYVRQTGEPLTQDVDSRSSV